MMKLVSPLNEINYGNYDEGLDWNIQNFQARMNGKNGKAKKAPYHTCLRLNIFAPKLQAEIELLHHNESFRILLLGYDVKHDLYLEKSWMLAAKQFIWEGTPEKYQIQGRALGLDLSIQCDGSGALHFHFNYFDHYHLHFISHLHRTDHKPLRSVNPYDFDTWSFSEKHAMLDCSSIKIVLDGNDCTRHPGFATGFNLGYEWLGGYFPHTTKELRCQFWQNSGSSAPTQGPVPEQPHPAEKELPRPEEKNKLSEMAGTLLIMGHDSCSSESAIWLGQKIRYRLPRIVPTFGRSDPSQTASGKNLQLLP
ncbi:MAG: hypothetical protein AAF975_02805, partial [Spirochaetota bacterium]